MKTFVLDTNILLHDPLSIYSFGANEIVIPAIVLEELDSKKREQNEIGRNARMVTRIIKELRKDHEGKLSTGIPLDNGGILRVELNHISFEKLQDIFGEKTNDNRIIAVAKNLADELNREVILVSNDGLVIAKADALGLKVEMYDNDRIENLDVVHKGYHNVLVPKEMIDTFYDEKSEGLDFREVEPFMDDNTQEVFPQDFFILKDMNGTKQSALARLLEVGGKKKLVSLVMSDNEEVWGVKPRNAQQRMAMELLMDPNVSLVCLAGKAGTGKTLLALAAGLSQTEDDKTYKKVLVARPVIPMGKDIGYLPGDMNEKLRPWMQPIYDNLEFLLNIEEEEDDFGKGTKRTVETEMQQLSIEVEALTYIRGRSIPKQFIILDECQNLTKNEILTIISRAGEGTKIIMCGDPEQIDHPYIDTTNNALTFVIERMKQESDVGIVKLEKTERSSLAEKAAKLLK